MSADNDQDLRDRLDAALNSITPRPAPFDAAIRQGRGISTRRRVSVVTGLAAAVAVVVTVLAWPTARPAGPSPVGPLVTVVPPGPGSPAGLIASGSADGRPWSASAGPPSGGRQCFQAGSRTCRRAAVPPLSWAAPADPDQISGVKDGVRVSIGPVASAVTLVRIRLADGQVLDLHPVLRYGVRYIAYGLGPGDAVSSAIAYAGRSELASAQVLHVPGRPVRWQWHRPVSVPTPPRLLK